MAPFAFGSADPARKAALVALAPKLDSYFATKLAELRASGAAVGILLEGELVYEKGFGVQDVATRRPVDSDTVFRIASLTKSFTALAVMKLRDEGNSKEKAARTANAAARDGRDEVGERGGHAENYEDRTVDELRERAKDLGIEGYSGLKKDQLIDKLRNH